MFSNSKAFSGFSVNDLEQTKDFYRQTLGLQVAESAEGLELRLGSGASVFIYPKTNHVPASFTVLNFPVDNIEKTVAELRKRKVHFEHYNNSDIKTDEDGIFRGAGLKVAWFKDPAGNVLSVLEEH